MLALNLHDSENAASLSLVSWASYMADPSPGSALKPQQGSGLTSAALLKPTSPLDAE